MSNRPRAKQTPSARVAEARSAGGGSSIRLWIAGGVGLLVAVVIGIAVVGALLAAVIVTTRGADAPPAIIKGGGTVVKAGPLTYGDVSINGSLLPEQPEKGGPDPAIGQPVPEIKGEQFDGKALTIPASGTPKVVMFVAHWCPHCQKEVPLIAEYLAANGLPADVDLYAVSTSSSESQPNFPASDWLHDVEWPVPTIADDAQNRAAAAYGIGGFPYFVVVGADGKVIDRQSGEKTMAEFQAMIDAARSSASVGAPNGSTPG